MLCMVKMPLKGEVGDRALNSHGNYIVDDVKSWENHGIVFLNFCGNPVPCPYVMEIIHWLKFMGYLHVHADNPHRGNHVLCPLCLGYICPGVERFICL